MGPDGGFDHELFSKYMKFNEELHKAGVLIASEGINPGRKGARVGVAGGKRTVVDGPFTETKELIGGFYIIDVGVAGRGDLVGAALPGRARLRQPAQIKALTDLEDIPPDAARAEREGRARVDRVGHEAATPIAAFIAPALRPSGGSSGCRLRCARKGRGRSSRPAPSRARRW